MKLSSKKWVISLIGLLILILVIVGAAVVIVDPYFHYHKPSDKFEYTLENERYQNDGIVKHFDYDAIITGSSMTECFKPSELDALFGVNAIKVPYSGGSFKEVNDLVAVAIEHNPDIKMVVRCLDANRFLNSKDELDYEDYPDYLYDDNLLNDVNYLFNKYVLIDVFESAFKLDNGARKEISFDEYADWSGYYAYGYDAVMATYERDTLVPAEEMLPITEEDYATIKANIEQNVIALAEANPDIEFYYYVSPYSIYCMDYWKQIGILERQLLAEKYIIELLLPYENIHFFSFNTEYDLLCNADNYRDVAHHSGQVNSQILQWIYEGKHELTYDNYQAYCAEVYDFYMNYDYDALFE